MVIKLFQKLIFSDPKNFIRNCVTLIYSGWFIYIGIMHFTDPSWFEPIVPKILGNPKFWVFLSGFFEILLGLILIPRYTRTVASIFFIFFLVLVYWANVYMWIYDIPIGGELLSNTEHVFRGLIQILLILIVIWIGQPYRKIFSSGLKQFNK